MNGPAGEPARAAGRADATGPLPVAVPVDDTGPMPAPPVTSAPEAPGPADATGPQPLLDGGTAADDAADDTAGGMAGDTAGDTTSSVPTGPVAETPSWFAEGEPVAASATGTAPGALTGEFPVATAAAAAPRANGAPVDHSADPLPAPNGAPGMPTASAPPLPPATSVFDAFAPATADTGIPPATNLYQGVGTDETVEPHPTDDATPPATGLFEPVAPLPADTGTAPATGLFESAAPHPAGTGAPPATGLFDAVPLPPADSGTSSATSLFEPATPHPNGAGSAPATGLLETVGPADAAPTGAAGTDGASPGGLAVDTTGPIPAVDAAPAAAPTGSEPGSGGAAANGGAPAATAVPLAGSDAAAPAARPSETDAWSFGPHSGALPGPPSPEADVRDGRRARVRTHPPATVPAPATTAGGAPRRSWWPLTVLAMLVAIAGGIALVFSIAQNDPDDLVAYAAEDLRSWNGVRYEGAIAALDGGEIQFDVTVTADGASGTLTRNGGQATAELLWDESGTLLRANRQWWLYHHGARADELADRWFAEPLTETKEIDPILALHPAALAQHISPEEPASSWEAIGQQLVGGRTAILLSDGTRRVVVSNDAPNRLVALDLGPTGRAAPVQVSDVPPDEAGAVGGRAAAVRSAESPKTLTQRLRERPLVEIKLEPEPLCVTETCGVTVTVTNSGAVPAQGRLEISAGGEIVATHPMNVHPGQVATFTATAPNPHFADPGSTGEILWESRAVDG